jgi:hypothetical protein
VHELLDVLTSPFAGFLLKCIAGVATAHFGLTGFGAKTRDAYDSLTPKGRNALIGLLVSDALGLGSAFYDYFSQYANQIVECASDSVLMVSR